MLEEIIKNRAVRLKAIKEKGINPYPAEAKRTIKIAEGVKNFNKFLASKKKFFVVGRLRSWRDQGNLIFTDLEDASGKIQLILKKNLTRGFPFFKSVLDVGDFVEVSGKFFKTKRGEKSLEVSSIKILTKSLRPLPTEWYGLKDVEDRYRHRYLDFILNSASKDKIILRSKTVEELRKILWQEGFSEVETPILQPLPGGALAKPFKTFYNALDEDFYLRVAPELYLKRLLVGGFEKIFEIGKDFRNEGVDRSHNPEFTMLELYWAYADYKQLMKFTKSVILKLLNSLKLKKTLIYQGQKINFGGNWKIYTFDGVLREFIGAKANNLNNQEVDEVFKKEVRGKLINPTFIINHPKAISPLAKANEKDSDLVDRFQLVVGGFELVNAFSELNDPIDQRERMEEQEKMYRAGDEEASRLDEDFLEALEYGMPPTAGLGMGIDRLAAILTDSHNIKEIIPFPTLRSK